jgi:hypothetical protein
MQRDRLVARGIDIAPYPLSHLAVRVADWDGSYGPVGGTLSNFEIPLSARQLRMRFHVKTALSSPVLVSLRGYCRRPASAPGEQAGDSGEHQEKA